MAEPEQWLSGVSALLGAWVFVAAFLFTMPTNHFWNSVVVGAAIVVLGAYAYTNAADPTSGRRYATGLAALLGLWMIASPFVFALETGTALFWSDVVAGILVAVLSGYDTYETGAGAGVGAEEREPAQ